MDWDNDHLFYLYRRLLPLPLLLISTVWISCFHFLPRFISEYLHIERNQLISTVKPFLSNCLRATSLHSITSREEWDRWKDFKSMWTEQELIFVDRFLFGFISGFFRFEKFYFPLIDILIDSIKTVFCQHDQWSLSKHY